MKTVEKLLHNSIETELCCRCGACVGVCPADAITINPYGVHITSIKCVDCGLCTRVCPAEGYVLSDLTYKDVVDIPKFAIASTDESLINKSSSGGFVTQTLLSLLKNGDITAAAVVVTGDNLTDPLARYIVTSDPKDILSARRSKYTQASIDNVLKYIKQNDGRYAVVGLPCQLYAIKKAMEKLSVLRERIVYRIGMVCGYTYEESCIDGLLRVLGTTRTETESIIGWREGGLPGNFSVKQKNGDVLSMPFIDEHSVDVTYFAQNRCLLCKDCLCEYGDVVCADIGGWSKRKTLVMVRTAVGQNLLKKVRIDACFTVEPCDVPFEKTVLPFMLREKRAKVSIRILRYKKKGKPATAFVGGYSPKLLVSQKIEAMQSTKLQEYARKNRDTHSREKMLKIGHKSYHKLSEKFVLKVFFKLQVWAELLWAKANRLCTKIIDKLFLLLPNPSLLKAKEPINVAVIGLGRWGGQYLSLLKKSSDYKIVAAYDNDRNKLKVFSRQYGFSIAESINDLCLHYGAEAVFVLTPTTTHSAVFAEISKFNLPVYMEKPIASNPSETACMIAAANQKNILLYVAHSMKYEPAVQKIREILDSNILGDITNIRIVRTVKSRNDNSYPNAALYQIGVHLIDILLYLKDGKDSADSYAHIRRTIQGKIDTVTFKWGKTDVCLRYGFGSLYNFSLYMSGENGHVLLAEDLLKTIVNGKETVYHIPMKNEKTVYFQLDEFYRAVRKGESFLNTKEHAESIISLCEQITKVGECHEY